MFVLMSSSALSTDSVLLITWLSTILSSSDSSCHFGHDRYAYTHTHTIMNVCSLAFLRKNVDNSVQVSIRLFRNALILTCHSPVLHLIGFSPRRQQSIPRMTNSADIRSSTTLSSSSSSSTSSSTTTTTTSSSGPTNAYELSQDLHDKQIEMLEKKYGGSLRCRRAATLIQRAYRQYKLEQNFRHLCATIKTNKRLSCTFVDSNNNHQQIQTIKPLKPCLRTSASTKRAILINHADDASTSSSSSSNTPTNSDVVPLTFVDRHLDLPSINFEHFIETPKQPSTSKPKRVCIVTDQVPDEDIDDGPMDNISDFVDEHFNSKPLVLIESTKLNKIISNGHNGLLKTQPTSPSINESNYYKNLTDSPIRPRKVSLAKPMPPVRSLSLKPRSVLAQMPNSTTSPIWKRKASLTIMTDMNGSNDAYIEGGPYSTSQRLSPSSTTSSDRDNMSLQSTSSGSNSCSLSASLELHQQQQPLLIQHHPVLHGHERTSNIRTNEIYRRRCYRAGLNIFNK